MDKINFGIASRNYFNMPFWVAQHRGFFIQENIDVECETIEHIPDMDSHVRSGRFQFAYNATEQVVLSIEQGASVAVVGGNVERLPFSFIARRDVRDIAGLRGRTIGVSSLDSGTSSLLRRFLSKHGLSYQHDYAMVAVGPIITRWAMLQSGEIAAGLQGIPLNYVALDSGYIDLGDIAEGIDAFEFTSLVVNTKWAATRRDVAVRFMRAMIRSHEWLFANRDEATAIAVAETGLDFRYAQRAWDDFTSRAIFPRDADVSVTGVKTLLSLTAQVRDLQDRSGDSHSRYIDRSFLLDARNSMHA
jgi:ABC-type nitrate/sulfonate/bicarbonate transport system substrate-binding protein